MELDPRGEAPRTTHGGRGVLLVSLVAALGGVLFGYGTAVVSGALLYIDHDFALNDWQEGALVASALLGATIMVSVSGRLADRYGRKPLILAMTVLYALGSVVSMLAPGIYPLLAGRMLVGFGLGSLSFVVPLYIAEIAPQQRRGFLVTLNQLMVTVGILAAFAVGYAFSGGGQWRLMLAAALLPTVIMAVGTLFVPESPRWLLARGDEVRARAAAAVTGLTDDLDALRRQLTPPPAQREARGSSNPASTRFIWMTALMAFTVHLSGLNTAIYYAPRILSSGGLGIRSSVLGSVIIGVVNLLMTFVAMAALDRLGRRALFLGGLALMAVSGAGISLASFTGHQGSPVTVVLMCVFIAAGAVGPAPVFWVYISEIFPQQVRGRAMSLATTALWAADTIVALTFVPLVDHFSFQGTFLLYCGLTIVAIVGFGRSMPETRGRSLEEIALQTGQFTPSARG
ncbi:sugar porter family MFS transporter [Streptomyces sp. NPDC090442]|uniref:sugar porter family MFS transporter n=1 Tax=Streptomyces sp. NPDC090442 TaxID=3365962 RepID=UPI00381D8F62